jgi:hypothetical protein
MRTYRLTNEPGGLGLSCTAAGLSLAGTPLLRKTDEGFAPRPAAEIVALMNAVYSGDAGAARLESSLPAIARALNDGELARAAIAAALTRMRELTPYGARRLAAANEHLTQYDPDQPRDPAATPARAAVDQGASPAPDASATIGSGAPQNGPRWPKALERAFESQYDDLGPVEFAKQVLQFGDHLARGGATLPPDEKDPTLAEYAFLEDRLSFWLAYEYTPPTAQGNLLAAAGSLFQGALLSGIVEAAHLPTSMLDVAADVSANRDPPLRFGGIVDNSKRTAINDKAPNTAGMTTIRTLQRIYWRLKQSVGARLWERPRRVGSDHKDPRMTPGDLPFSQWADFHRTDRFICAGPLSGYSMVQPEDDGYMIYLPPDATNAALGQALLKCLDKSRFIWPRDEPQFFEWRRYVPLYQNWQKDFMARYGYKTKREAYRNMDWCRVTRSEGRISIQPHKRDKPEYFRSLPPDRTVVIPTTTDALGAGAALRQALDRCE